MVAEFEQAIKDAFGDVIVPMGAELTILNAGEKFAGPMVVSVADVNGGTEDNHVALQATFSGEDGNVTPEWSVTGPFKIGKLEEQAILTKLDADVKAGDVGTLTASYKGISTTVQVVVK